MITTVTFNPALDIYSQVNEISIGQVNRVETSDAIAAGKGINVSTVLKALKGEVQATGFLAQQNQQLFKSHLTQFAIEDLFISVPGFNRENIKLIDKQQVVTEINYPGFSVTSSLLKKLQQQLFTLPENSLIVIAGSLAKGISQAQFKTLLLTLKAANYRLVIDCSGASLATAIDVSPELIKPNLTELEEYFHCTLDNEGKIKAAVGQLIEQGVKQVLLSLGEQGLIYFNADKIIKVSVPKVAVKNSVGAGDTLLAGYLWASEQRKGAYPTTQRCLCFAAALASARVAERQWQTSVITSAQQLLAQVDYQVELI